MLNKDILTKRLALIKFLYKQGLDQSKQTEPISAFSILSFHDSIEMFLKLVAEHQNIKSDNFSLMDFWKYIPSLTLIESMRNLNTRRNNIKHKGLLPSKSDIEVSRVNTTDFYTQNVITLLGIDFSSVSLITLVQDNQVRKYLEEAQQALDKNDHENCIKNVAIGFHILLHSYENSKSSYYRDSPFFFGKDLSFNKSFHIGIGRDYENHKERKLADFIDNVVESLDGIQSAIKIMSFGIDYRHYVKFKLLTPKIFSSLKGDKISFSTHTKQKKWTSNNCQYCIDFVVESALKLQDFDFDLKELEEETISKPNSKNKSVS